MLADVLVDSGLGAKARTVRVCTRRWAVSPRCPLTLAHRVKQAVPQFPQLAPGTRLRSERDLAAHYEVAYHTIRRAMEVLRERGLIVSIHGRGTFVRELPAPES